MDQQGDGTPTAMDVEVPVQDGTLAGTGAPYQAYQHVKSQQHEQQRQRLQLFWANQFRQMEQTTDFKSHSFPLATIKKIMEAEDDVRMVAAEAPVVFARACEMFILELTHRSWAHAEKNKRRTLEKNDIAAAIARSEVFDFLVDIVPREEEVEEENVMIPQVLAGLPADQLFDYYVQQE